MLNQVNDIQALMISELHGLVSVQQWAALGRRLDGYAAPDVAEFLEGLDPTTRSVVFRGLPRAEAGAVFAHLEPERQEALLHDLAGAQTCELLASLPPDDRTALLVELPANVTQRLLTTLDPADLREARQLLGYPEDSVGRLMTPEFVRVREKHTVAEGLAHIGRYGRNAETLDAICIIDARGA